MCEKKHISLSKMYFRPPTSFLGEVGLTMRELLNAITYKIMNSRMSHNLIFLDIQRKKLPIKWYIYKYNRIKYICINSTFDIFVNSDDANNQ